MLFFSGDQLGGILRAAPTFTLMISLQHWMSRRARCTPHPALSSLYMTLWDVYWVIYAYRFFSPVETVESFFSRSKIKSVVLEDTNRKGKIKRILRTLTKFSSQQSACFEILSRQRSFREGGGKEFTFFTLCYLMNLAMSAFFLIGWPLLYSSVSYIFAIPPGMAADKCITTFTNPPTQNQDCLTKSD